MLAINWYCWGMKKTYKWMRQACAAALFKPEVSARYDISHLFSLNVGAVFKWSTKLITRLKLLPGVIGWIMSRQFFNQWKEKPKLITPCMCDFFSRALSKFQVIAKNSDWFIALSAPVLIGGSNYFDIGFSTVIRKPLYDTRGFTELLCKPLKKRARLKRLL